MGRLFHSMMTTYDDVDIKDRARFYYALLTGASDEKVSWLCIVHVLVGVFAGSTVSWVSSGLGTFFQEWVNICLEAVPCACM